MKHTIVAMVQPSVKNRLANGLGLRQPVTGPSPIRGPQENL
jgi:hypothetical protein